MLRAWMRIFLVGLLMVGASPVFAADGLAGTTRPGCDSCRFQVDHLDKPFKLTGTWLFTRDDSPQNASVGLDASAWRVIKAPGPWKKAYDDGKNFSVGWYRGIFEFNPALIGQEVVFLVDAYMGRVAVHVDGSEIYRRPGNINIERYYSAQPIPVRFTVTQPRHVVAIRVETQLMTGIYQLPFEMHKYDPRDTSLAMYQFWGGELRLIVAYVVFFFGLFFMLVYWKTRYALYLVASLASLMVFPFFAAPGDNLLRVFSPEKLFFLHYLGISITFMAYLFSQFFYKFTPKINWILGSIYGLMALIIASMTLYPNLDLFQKVRSAYFMMTLFWGLGATYLSFRAILLKKPGAVTLFIGILAFLIAALHDMVLAFGLIASVGLIFVGVAIFTGSMLFVASNMFANTFLENKHLVTELKGLNDNLENLVAERTLQLRQKTNDIQNMLQNMPQGVLTVTEGDIVHPEYSAYLETIFETRDIAGRNLMDLVFEASNLGSDVLAQIEVAVASCIGQDRMNFDFNTHLLVGEFERTMANGRVKSLELSWSPICDEQDTVEKMMLCVRDVSELKTLAAEANQQKRELEIIGQILSVSQEKFHEFVDSSEKFISENEEIIKQLDTKDQGIVAKLFRNMHTIKGNARTYGMLHLTNKVHETEQAYDEMRKNPDSEWDQAKLLTQLHETYALLKEYASINDGKLGRRGPGRRGSVDKFLMVEKDKILYSLQMLEEVDRSNVAALSDALVRVRKTLHQIGAEPLGEILAGIIESLPSLAKELGKEAPKIAIVDNDILVRSQISGLLKNVFMHLLRNSMDHGIEKPEQRVAAGKPAAGSIRLEITVSDGRLWMNLGDDGRGLAIGRIRQKALENNVLRADSEAAPEAVAQLIFASGFSTAEKVTEVSGRGVGMDAVKGFLEREGGTIEIRFIDAEHGADFRQFITVISLPDKFAVTS